MVAGFSLLAMTALAIFAEAGVRLSLVVPGDADATLAAIAASEPLFRAGVLAYLGVAFLDVLVAWGLYVVLEPVDRHVSLFAAWLRLAYASVLVVATGHLYSAAQWAHGADADAARMMDALAAFEHTWMIGLAIFGAHLVVAGWLVTRGTQLPRWLGAAVMIAGAGYVIDTVVKVAAPDANVTVAQVTFVGEVLLMIRLLSRPLTPARPT